MNRREAERVKASFGWFAPCGPAMIAKVMRNLADTHPGVRAMFPDDAAHVNEKIFATLGQVVRHIDRFHKLEVPLASLGAMCAREGANPGHYTIFRDELLVVMEELAGDDWDAQLSQDWTEVFDAVSGAMLAGAISEQIRRAA